MTDRSQPHAAGAGEPAQNEVDAALKAGKIVAAQREWAIKYWQADPAAFRAFAARAPAIFGKEPARIVVHISS